MARVLLLSLVFPPDAVSTAMIMGSLAADLQALGHEVAVLTATPHYNVDPEALARQALRPRLGRLLYESDFGGIRVWHVRVPSKSKNPTGRMLGYVVFHAISTLAGLGLGRFDVILAPSPPLTIGLSAWALAARGRIPFVFNVQEIYPDVAVRLGVLRRQSMIRALEAVERFVYGRAASIVVISEWFRRVLTTKGVPDGKVRVIPNFVDTDAMRPGERDNAFARQFGLTERFIVLYAGNIGLTQAFDTILEAARRLDHMPDVLFAVVGDGVLRGWLQDRIDALNLGNVRLLPYQPASIVPYIYACSDVALVPLKHGTAQGTFPSKIYTIMASGRPAIVSADDDSEATWLVRHARCGLAIPPDDPSALANAIRYAYGHQTEFRQYGMNGREFVVQHYSRPNITRRYHDLILSLTNGRSG